MPDAASKKPEFQIFTEYLIARYRSTGRSKERLARDMDISTRQVDRWEKGKNAPNRINKKKLRNFVKKEAKVAIKETANRLNSDGRG